MKKEIKWTIRTTDGELKLVDLWPTKLSEALNDLKSVDPDQTLESIDSIHTEPAQSACAGVFVESLPLEGAVSSLKVGDQLLQVNGHQVVDSDQALQMINESIGNVECGSIALYVCRVNPNHDHRRCARKARRKRRRVLRWLCREQSTSIASSFSRSQQRVCVITNNAKDSKVSSLHEPAISDVEINDKLFESLSNQAADKDSGLGRTDENGSTDYESLAGQVTSKERKSSVASTASLEREMQLLNQEMYEIQLQCEALNRQLRLNEQLQLESQTAAILNPPIVTVNDLPNEATRTPEENALNHSKCSKSKITKSSVENNHNISSAKATKKRMKGVRFRSNSLESLLQLESAIDLNVSEHEYAVINYASTGQPLSLEPECGARRDSKAETTNQSADNRIPPPLPPLPPQLQASFRKSLSAHHHPPAIRPQSLNRTAYLHTATMYTNQANLEQTMRFQQQLLRQAIQQQKSSNKMSASHSAKELSSLLADGSLFARPENESNAWLAAYFASQTKASQQPVKQDLQHESVGKSSEKNKVKLSERLHLSVKPKPKLILGQSEIKIKRKADGTRYISRCKLHSETSQHIQWPTIHQRTINCDGNVINSTLEFDRQPLLRNSIKSQGTAVASRLWLKPRGTNHHPHRTQHGNQHLTREARRNGRSSEISSEDENLPNRPHRKVSSGPTSLSLKKAAAIPSSKTKKATKDNEVPMLTVATV